MHTDQIIRGHMLKVIQDGALDIRDVDGGEEPFLYSSGNKGPGYVSIKGLVSRRIFRTLAMHLAVKLAYAHPDLDFVAGNVTGGVPPTCFVSEDLSVLLGRHIPMVYIRDSRKAGGHKELVTGLGGLRGGSWGVVIEEMINYGETTVNSTEMLREEGFVMSHAGCILNYDTPPNRENLARHDIQMVHLFTLEDLLDLAKSIGQFSPQHFAQYDAFRADPKKWMDDRGLKREEKGGTK